MAEVNEAKREKSQVEDINRSLYDFRYEEKDAYKVDAGLTPAIVEQISREKNDPDWMLELRLKSLEIYNKTGIPEWGPPIDELNMDDIITYVRPNTKMSAKWSEVPTDIKDTFEKLGIPQAERDSLAGVGAQYDSELVYHNVKKEVAEQGVIYTDLESAMHGPYAEMIRTHFMHLVPPTDHKFDALHGAVFFDVGNVWLAGIPGAASDEVFRFDSFYKELGFNTGFGLRYDLDLIVIRLDWGVRVHDPSLPAGQRWLKAFKWGNTALNFGIGYPF